MDGELFFGSSSAPVTDIDPWYYKSKFKVLGKEDMLLKLNELSLMLSNMLTFQRYDGVRRVVCSDANHYEIY